MKKILFAVLMLSFFVSACGKKDEVKKESSTKEGKTEVAKDDAFKDLKYSGEMSITDWSVINSLDKTTGGSNFVGSAFMLAINIHDIDTSLYDVCKDKFKDKYPLHISVEPNSKSNMAMVLLPNYITVDVNGTGGASGGLKEFDNPEMLKKLLSLFDFDGISKLPRENLKGNDLVKFMPKFETMPQQK